MVGNCTLPLAMVVVGGNMALVQLKDIDKKVTSIFLLGKLIILPALVYWCFETCSTHLIGF